RRPAAVGAAGAGTQRRREGGGDGMSRRTQGMLGAGDAAVGGAAVDGGAVDGAGAGRGVAGPEVGARRVGLLADLAANRTSDDPRRPGTAGVLPTVLTLRFAAAFLFRASALAGGVLPVLGSVLKQVNHLVTGADIAWSARIGPGLVLWH